jgi:glutamine amidotransferase
VTVVAIVDVGIGNLRSVQKAVERAASDRGLACSAPITPDPEEIRKADKVIVPGQGAFRDCSIALARGIGDVVLEQIRRGTPFLGICIGMQALFGSSEEAAGFAGLGLYAGTNVKMAAGQRDPVTGEAVKIPHMGWNQIQIVGEEHPYLRAAGGEGTYLYFTHSYYAAPDDRSLLAATARHGPFEITAAIARDNVFASQFHPEKSQAAGLALLGAFVKG